MSEDHPSSDQSFRHELTDLPNRRGFARAFEAATESGQPFAVLAVDVDGLKDVNDTQGHLAGDQLLVDVANAMYANSRTEHSPEYPERPTDVLAFASHTGGDEFLVLLYGIHNTEDIADYIKRLRANTPVGLSIGGREYVPGEDLETLLHDADALMQQEKDTRKLADLSDEQIDTAAFAIEIIRKMGMSPRDLDGIARALARQAMPNKTDLE